MTEIDKVTRRIHALLQKTKSNGCTEQEAMRAAEKAGELMDQFNLSISDIQIRDTACVQISIPVGGKVRPSWSSIVVALGEYCDGIVWFSKRSGEATFEAFGLKHDMEIFEFIYGVIKDAIMSETEKFKMSDVYKEAQYYKKARTATTSFQVGMAVSISAKLREMKSERIMEVERTGRELVMVKEERVRSEFKKIGISLKTTYGTSRRSYGAARSAGEAAGSKVNVNLGMRGSGNTKKMIA